MPNTRKTAVHPIITEAVRIFFMLKSFPFEKHHYAPKSVQIENRYQHDQYEEHMNIAYKAVAYP